MAAKVAPSGSVAVVPTQPPPFCSLGIALLAYTNCWLTSYVWTVPPKGHDCGDPSPQPGNDCVLNLKTNHQSTGWPSASRGVGGEASFAASEGGVPQPTNTIVSNASVTSLQESILLGCLLGDRLDECRNVIREALQI